MGMRMGMKIAHKTPFSSLMFQNFGNTPFEFAITVFFDALDSYKTKTVADCLKAIGAQKKTLIVLADNNAFAVKSIANIAGVKSAQINTINTYDIINADTLVIVKGAVAKLEEVYA